MNPRANFLELFCWRDVDSRRPLLTPLPLGGVGEGFESAHGSHNFRAIDSADGVMDLLPMLLAAPTDVVALNFFFNTLLFSGAILLLANSIDKEPAVTQI
jgi:hypothetical protein